MFAAWTIGINLITRSNFGLVAGNIARQSAAASESVSLLDRKMSGLKRAGDIANNTLIGVGVASAAAFAIGVKNASQMQDATIQAAGSMGRLGKNVEETTANMQDMYKLAISMSKMTGMSAPQAMEVVARFGSAGLSTDQVKSSYKQIGQFVDVLHLNQKDKMDYAEAGALGAVLTHDLRLFNEKDTKFGLASVAQLGYLSPHGTNQLTTQVRRMASPLQNVLPGNPQQRATTIVELAAWADRMGTLQFSGSAISQMLTQMLAPRSKRVLKGLEDLGVYDKGHMVGKKYVQGDNRFFNRKTQEFDLMGALHQVELAVSQGRLTGNDTAMKALFSGTQNMQRILMALTSKEALGAYQSIQKQHRAMGTPEDWLDKMQANLVGGLSGATLIATSNFQTLTQTLVNGLLPELTKVVKVLADFEGGLIDHLMTHPGQAKAVGTGMGLLGVAGIALAINKLGTFIGLPLGKVGHIFMKVGEDFLKLGDVAEAIGPKFSLLRVAIRGASVAILGATGLMVAIQAVRDHAGDAGYAVGQAARWIQEKGAAQLKDAVVAAFVGLGPAIGQALIQAVKNAADPKNMLAYLAKMNEIGPGGFSGMGFKAGQDLGLGIYYGYKAKSVKMGGSPSLTPMQQLKGLTLLGNTVGQPLSLLNSPLRSQAVGPVQVNVKVVNNH